MKHTRKMDYEQKVTMQFTDTELRLLRRAIRHISGCTRTYPLLSESQREEYRELERKVHNQIAENSEAR